MPACNRPAMRANVSRETSTRTGSAPYSAQCMTNRRPSSDFFLVSPVQTPISRTIPKKSEKVVDSMGQYRHNNFCCFDVRRYLSWIEGLTTNQYVGGSNPSGRTTFELVKTLLVRGFSFFKYQLVLGANGDESTEEGYQSQLRAKNNTTENNNRA